MSKSKFSKPSKTIIKQTKRIRSRMPKSEFSNMLSVGWREIAKELMSYESAGDLGSPYTKNERTAAAISLIYTFGNDKYHNLFLEDSDIWTFLSESPVNEISSASMSGLLNTFKKRFSVSTILIHSKDIEESILVTWSNKGDKIEIVDTSSFHMGMYTIPKHKIDDDEVKCRVLDKINESTTLRFLFNLAAYIDCFPEKIRLGPPPEMKREYGATGGSRLISNPKISRDENLYARSPHLRRGHMRLLKHERYGDNVGKWVYVRPTMVKGTAETVTH